MWNEKLKIYKKLAIKIELVLYQKWILIKDDIIIINNNNKTL